jgi:hypothetical protein
MVPHDARRLSEEDLNVFSLMDQQDPLISKNERFEDITSVAASTSTSPSSSGLFGEDLEIKPEIDTGTVSESCFSFKKLWKYTGPGKHITSLASLERHRVLIQKKKH